MTALLAAIAATFRAVARAGERGGLTVQVKEIDREAHTAKLLLIVIAKETWFQVEGDVEGLQEGQIGQLEIRDSSAHFEGRVLPMRKIVFVP